MSHDPHERRFSPEKMAKLDSPMRHERQPASPLVDALDLDPDTVVADLGVGTGFFARPIAARLRQLGGAGKVIGLDVSDEMLDEFERRSAEDGLQSWIKTRAVSGDGDLPLPDASVDRIISVNTVHELDDLPLVFAELRRLLRPGGKVILVDWRKRGPFDKGPPEDHRIGSEAVAAELRVAGFDVSFDDLYASFYAVSAVPRTG